MQTRDFGLIYAMQMRRAAQMTPDQPRSKRAIAEDAPIPTQAKRREEKPSKSKKLAMAETLETVAWGPLPVGIVSNS